MRIFKDDWPFEGYSFPSYYKIEGDMLYQWRQDHRRWEVHRGSLVVEQFNDTLPELVTELTEEEFFLDFL